MSETRARHPSHEVKARSHPWAVELPVQEQQLARSRRLLRHPQRAHATFLAQLSRALTGELPQISLLHVPICSSALGSDLAREPLAPPSAPQPTTNERAHHDRHNTIRVTAARHTACLDRSDPRRRHVGSAGHPRRTTSAQLSSAAVTCAAASRSASERREGGTCPRRRC